MQRKDRASIDLVFSESFRLQLAQHCVANSGISTQNYLSKAIWMIITVAVVFGRRSPCGHRPIMIFIRTINIAIREPRRMRMGADRAHAVERRPLKVGQRDRAVL